MGQPTLEERVSARMRALGAAETQFACNATIKPDVATTDVAREGAAAAESAAKIAAATWIADLPAVTVSEAAARDHADAPALGADLAILSVLGEGGMGLVQLARQRSLDRDIAVKTTKHADAVATMTLVREARLAGSLEHPGIIPVHALGASPDGRPLLVMKRVDGVTLSALLSDRAHQAWSGRSDDRTVAAVEILIQVCRTLEFAHSRGVLHRDIKPDNIMVGSFGETYLLDWGLGVKKGGPRPTSLAGTPAYMAPEMSLGMDVDERTDVYLLGATLHEILTGEPRHPTDSLLAALKSAAVSAPIAYDRDVPERLARLCNRATAREHRDRPQSAREFREQLDDFLRHRSARALTDAALERLDSLERELGDAGEGVPADLARAYRLLAEARFGLTQSLREHADDPDTRAAMRQCLCAAVELEIRQKHVESADALLRELDPPPPELFARLMDLRARGEAESTERRLLMSLAHTPIRPSRQRSAPGSSRSERCSSASWAASSARAWTRPRSRWWSRRSPRSSSWCSERSCWDASS